jgi:hypothetical protein
MLKEYERQEIELYLQDPHCNPPELIDRLLNGDCDYFAAAASEILGWSVYGIMENRTIALDGEIVQGDGLIHAVCFNPDKTGEIFDAKGYRSISNVFREYQIPEDHWFEHYSTGMVIVEAIRRTTESLEEMRKQVQACKSFILSHYELRSAA